MREGGRVIDRMNRGSAGTEGRVSGPMSSAVPPGDQIGNVCESVCVRPRVAARRAGRATSRKAVERTS